MKLSKRLQAIVDMVPDSTQSLADIGTDHGQLIIKLILDQKIQTAYGLDIASGPLMHAKANLMAYDLNDRVTLMKRDGLQDFDEAVDTIVIAGMGAETIVHILSFYEINKHQTVLVQSNTKQPWLRKTLNEMGFEIIDEQFLFDNQKPVFIMKLMKGYQACNYETYLLGPILKSHLNPSYLHYLKQRLLKLDEILEYKPENKLEYDTIQRYLGEVKS